MSRGPGVRAVNGGTIDMAANVLVAHLSQNKIDFLEIKQEITDQIRAEAQLVSDTRGI